MAIVPSAAIRKSRPRQRIEREPPLSPAPSPAATSARRSAATSLPQLPEQRFAPVPLAAAAAKFAPHFIGERGALVGVGLAFRESHRKCHALPGAAQPAIGARQAFVEAENIHVFFLRCRDISQIRHWVLKVQ